MKTRVTITLDPGLLREARAVARLRKTTLSALIEELLEQATRERVLAAAHIKATHAMSYADAFVVAAAQEMRATILTGDPEFRTVEGLVPVEWLAR